MDQFDELLKRHMGMWVNIYVTGFTNALGGKVASVSSHYVELDQEENVLAYIPLDRIGYMTTQKPEK